MWIIIEEAQHEGGPSNQIFRLYRLAAVQVQQSITRRITRRQERSMQI